MERLAAAFRSSDPARDYLFGIMVSLRDTLQTQLINGIWTQFGEEMTKYRRSALEVVEYLLALPSRLEQVASAYREAQEMGAPEPAEPQQNADWPDLNAD